MKLSNSTNVLRVGILGILIALSLPAVALGQGRGRGKDKGFSGLGSKCDKFVNCHDARDGRWDGRGPRRSTLVNDRSIWRNNDWRNRSSDWRNNDWRQNDRSLRGRNRNQHFDRDESRRLRWQREREGEFARHRNSRDWRRGH
jgi:hypothetical protein